MIIASANSPAESVVLIFFSTFTLECKVSASFEGSVICITYKRNFSSRDLWSYSSSISDKNIQEYYSLIPAIFYILRGQTEIR